VPCEAVSGAVSADLMDDASSVATDASSPGNRYDHHILSRTLAGLIELLCIACDSESFSPVYRNTPEPQPLGSPHQAELLSFSHYPDAQPQVK
jgi:hypothetical protein